MNLISKIILWGLLLFPGIFDKCQGNKYRANLDKYTKIFQYQTSEVELHFPNSDINYIFENEEKNFQNQKELENSRLANMKDNKYTFMILGGKEFLCGFGEYGRNGYLQESEEIDPSWDSMDSNIKNYLKKSKISWLMERCFIFTKKKDINNGIHIQVDMFEICIGVSVRHKRQIIDKETNNNILESQFNVIGDYKLNEDSFYQNGTVIQYYNPAIENLKGDSGYSASIEFKCSYNQSGINQVLEDINKDFKPVIKVEFLSPSFCDWRVDESKNITSLDKLETLLLPLENRCQNFTDFRFWNYELCNLYAVSQFKKDTSNQETRLFHLGIHPNTAQLLNKTNDLDEYLSNNLISNIVNTIKPGKFSLLENVTATIEPRNKNELVSGNYVYRKYVITVRLSNGTFCVENNQQRSIKLVFECPENFESMSDYFKIVNVIEYSTCSYEMLILSPVICSHPMLMPPPIYQHRKIKCLPKNLILDKFIKDKSTLEDSHRSQQTEKENEVVSITRINNQFEAIKTEYITSLKKGDTIQTFFTMGNSPRIRNSNTANPKFLVGQIVQHLWWNYYGVIIGWDWKLNAPKQWEDYIYQKYPPKSKEKPHYLLLIHQNETLFNNTSPINSIPSNFTHSYIPEIALTHVSNSSSRHKFSSKSIINNVYISAYFSHWSEAHQRFIPNSNSTLWKIYPTDFGELNKRDEL
ncbi:uncharacterized protein cubi_00283 [Cryptosporidium ubiquitum]|uniref:MRH domain-containing protein n=1 Tax=Cryptosporidium ubiquitum TaxID=857276 RepID=A0A1J4MKD7_9CRYT|nr:uncharacterized protein cubi_00283 [Cryptosporidium ubiquitum]OII74730.1 hypothetical protein cubi_00283 [Cryptosporidium ubiquitum]